MSKFLKFLFIAAWCAGMASWFPLERVEDGALSHPSYPTSLYSQPLHIKGVVRYVTPTELLVDDIASKTFFLACLIGAISGGTFNYMDRKAKAAALQKILAASDRDQTSN